QRDNDRSAAAARIIPGRRTAERCAAREDLGGRRRSDDAARGAGAAGGIEAGAMSVSKRDVIASLGQPKVAAMLMLGFSSGLPFFLTGNTLGYWMRDEGT